MTETTLILSDIHLKVDHADKIIKHVKADKVICVGDIFDDFGDNAEMIRRACMWYVDFVNNPNNIMLYGNHCVHYGFPYHKLRCSGYEQWKYFIIHDNIPSEVWNKVKWYHFLDNTWLLTHAGLHRDNVPQGIRNHCDNLPKFISELSQYLTHEIQRGLHLAANNEDFWIFNAGYARGGNQKVGGITWCDHKSEMIPLIGLNQIYGHSVIPYDKASCLSQDSIKSKPYFVNGNEFGMLPVSPSKSYNICIDVWQNMHYAVWNGKELKIGNYNELAKN